MSTWIIALAAFLGGLAAATLGYLESKEPFEPKKFARSVIVALVAAASFAVGFTLGNGASARDVLLAFLSGAGLDVIANRALGLRR